MKLSNIENEEYDPILSLLDESEEYEEKDFNDFFQVNYVRKKKGLGR